MRLFKSPWPYLLWLALFLNQSWQELRPRAHPPLPPWHPLFNGIFFSFAEIFCLCFIFSIAKLTTNPLERAALALLSIAFALSTVIDVHALARIQAPLPPLRLVFLTINTILVLLTAIRFIQVFRDRPLPDSQAARSRSTND
jgi:hypothetical protein